jgi:hypothetical protein
MIYVEDQFYFSASIRTKSDFIGINDLVDFVLEEQAGNNFPKFELQFYLYDDSFLPNFTEGNTLKVQLGRNRDSIQDLELSISKTEIIPDGSSKKLLRIIGLTDNLDYVINSNTFISPKQSGIKTAIDKASKYFKVKSNIQASTDSQNWVQPNCSDRKFVEDCIMHSYKKGTFFAFAYTGRGELIIKDMVQELKLKEKEYDWYLSNNGTDPKNIPFLSDYPIISRTGFINSWVGYGRKVRQYDLDDGSESSFIETYEPFFALTSNVAKKSSVSHKFDGSAVLNENMHKKYHETFYNNLVNCAAMGNYTIPITIKQKEFVDFRPLDIVMFKDYSTLDSSKSNEFTSGAYIINKVVRRIKDKEMMTMIDICREAINNTRNE